MKYSLPYTTRWHDTDATRRVRPSQLLVYMQETSNQHVASIGMPLDELRDKKCLAFILSRLRFVIHKPLYAFEDITVETFTTPGRGYSSCRAFRILRGEEIIAEADSTWALVNTETGALCRPEESGYPFENEEAPEISMPNRIRFPSDVTPEEIGTRRIVYSDLDYNMHMNNTRYPDMLCDFLPAEDVERVCGMTLSYLHEATFGHTLRILRAKKDDCYFFRTVDGDGTACLEAQIQLK